MSPQSEQHVQESSAGERAPISEVIERPASEGVWSTSNLNKVDFFKSYNAPSGMPPHEEDNVWKVSKMSKIVDPVTTVLSRSSRLADKDQKIWFTC